MVEALITTVQTKPFPRAHGMSNNMQTWCKKQTEPRNTMQTKTAIQNLTKTNKPMVNNKLSNIIDYFLPGHNCKSDKRVNAEITQFPKRFWRCFWWNWVLWWPENKPYHVPLRCVAYTLQRPFKEELKWLKKQDIIAPLCIDETAEWWNSFVLVTRSNGGVKICLDPAGLDQTLIWLEHRGPKLNDILSKLNNASILLL